MLNHKGVAAEIQRLQQRVADAHDVTVESLIRELEEARQSTAAVQDRCHHPQGAYSGLEPPAAQPPAPLHCRWIAKRMPVLHCAYAVNAFPL